MSNGSGNTFSIPTNASVDEYTRYESTTSWKILYPLL
jgi:hypothetical protein